VPIVCEVSIARRAAASAASGSADPLKRAMRRDFKPRHQPDVWPGMPRAGRIELAEISLSRPLTLIGNPRVAPRVCPESVRVTIRGFSFAW
jgi:hypothetical protein